MKEKDQLARIAVAAESLANDRRPRDTSRPPKKARRGDGLLYRFECWFRTSDKKSYSATMRRRAMPIMAYVGPNGGGKTLAMVKDTVPSLARGRRVLSTVRLLDGAGNPHPAYERFTDWEQLLDARDCDVLMDEIVGVAGAREAGKMPTAVQNVLVQLRRRNVLLRWSAPNWARADKIVREVTQGVTLCTGHHPDRRAQRAGADDAVQLWAPKRLFRFRTFDTIDFDEWTAAKTDKMPMSLSEWFQGPGSLAFASYDTLDAVEMVGGASDDTGRCMSCNGVRKPKPCRCGTDAPVSGPVSLELESLRLPY